MAVLSNGNAFVVWKSDQTGNADIYGRVVAPNGTALTNDVPINQNTAGDQDYTSVAALSNGNAFVVWWSNQAGPYDIYGRVVAPNGTALTNDFLINQNTAGNQLLPSVAALSNGNAFVVWQNQTGTWDIYGRVLAPNGTSLTSDFLINQNITGDQYNPSVTMLSNGNVFVAWNGDQTGTYDIYGRVVAPNGTALADEFRINQNTSGIQENPSVAALSNGNAFVVWQGNQTGNSDIYGRIFDPSDLPVTTTGFQTTAGLTTGLVTTGLQTTVGLTTGLVTTRLQTTVGLTTGLVTTRLQTTVGLTTGPVTTRLQTTVGLTTGGGTTGSQNNPLTGLQTTAGFQTTKMSLNPNNHLIPILLGVGATTVGLSIGGSLIGVCALAGLYVVKKCKMHPQKQSKTENPYGTPPELLPAWFSEQEAVVNTSTIMPPASTSISPSRRTTRPKPHRGTENAYGTPAELLPKGFSEQKTVNQPTRRGFNLIPRNGPPHELLPKGFSNQEAVQSHVETENPYGTPPELLPEWFSNQAKKSAQEPASKALSYAHIF